MNPNYVIKFGYQKIEGPKAYGGGKNPVWNDFDSINHKIMIDDINSGEVEISFHNDGDNICSLKLSVPELIATHNANKLYESKRNGKKSGEFKMQAVYDGPRPEESKYGDFKKPVAPAVGIATGTPIDQTYGAPPMGAPVMGAPQMGAPPMGAPLMGAPPMGAPPMGAPPMGAYPHMGAAPTGPPINTQ
jgi:hypothetical protein